MFQSPDKNSLSNKKNRQYSSSPLTKSPSYPGYGNSSQKKSKSPLKQLIEKTNNTQQPVENSKLWGIIQGIKQRNNISPSPLNKSQSMKQDLVHQKSQSPQQNSIPPSDSDQYNKQISAQKIHNQQQLDLLFSLDLKQQQQQAQQYKDQPQKQQDQIIQQQQQQQTLQQNQNISNQPENNSPSKEQILNQQYEDYQHQLKQIQQQNEQFYSSKQQNQFQTPTRQLQKENLLNSLSINSAQSYNKKDSQLQSSKNTITSQQQIQHQQQQLQQQLQQLNSSSKKQEIRKNVFENLYNDHRRKIDKHEKLKREQDEEKHKIDTSYTFHPNIFFNEQTQQYESKNLQAISATKKKEGDIVQRNKKWMATKQKKLEQIQIECTQQYFQECTFQPKLNDTSNLIAVEDFNELQQQQQQYNINDQGLVNNTTFKGVDLHLKRQQQARLNKQLKEQNNKPKPNLNNIDTYVKIQHPHTTKNTSKNIKNFKQMLHQQLHDLQI